MTDDERLQHLAQATQRLINDQVDRRIVLDAPTLIEERGRSLVLRCEVQGHPDILSLVVKHNTGDDQRGFNDWASLQFLARIPQTNGIAPRFYAGDPDARIVVMEDLGVSRSLGDVLEGSDEPSVLETLRALALPMARLVAATNGKEQEFAGLRASLPDAADAGRLHEAEHWIGGRNKIDDWADALGVALPAGFDDAFNDVAATFARPGQFLAFSHGDPAPSNNHIRGQRVRLLDFEYGAYRHALYDLSGWYVLCPLHEDWVAVLTNAFRHELAQSGAAALVGDDRAYSEGWAAMCAYRALAMLTWFPQTVLETEHPWTPGWTMRQAMISTCLRLERATRGSHSLAALSAWGGLMAQACQARWPEHGDGALLWPGVRVLDS